MSEKFTQGVWWVNDVGIHFNNPKINQYEICWSKDGECVVDHVYELADAYLIAEAPEMYREIQNEIEFLTSLVENFPVNSVESIGVCGRIEALKVVSTKARGEHE